MKIKGFINFVPSEQLRTGKTYSGVRLDLDVEFTEKEKNILKELMTIVNEQ